MLKKVKLIKGRYKKRLLMIYKMIKIKPPVMYVKRKLIKTYLVLIQIQILILVEIIEID